ncbi:MFS-type transporter SLC18B1-like [Actinia tenebrosa]|uniref:MFS-type transporter SLC18B1-like n=1 Tax=Actinia tenebrosa TaxID=6105 RepID=A0A6P8IUG6_ACTTE|nr:MFS-type transporter SLC18B1-like [Actinia tenebrosa]
MAATMRAPSPFKRMMSYEEPRDRSNTKSPVNGVCNGGIHSPVPAKTDEDEEKAKETTTVEPVEVKIWGTARQKLTIVCLAVVYFATCAAFSVLSPFFPKEAANKGASGTVIGLIFGVYSLVSFLVSPLIGVIIPKVGARFTITCGLLLMGGSESLFGFVDSMQPGTIYITFCFILRIVSAIGGSMADVAIFAIVAGAFPKNLGAVMGAMETFSGLGFMAGPPLGGALYTYGGFKVPFLTLGGLVLLTLPLVLCVLPMPDESSSEQRESGSLLAVLKIPGILVLASCILLSGVVLGFLDPTLSPHMAEFGLNASKIGLMFLLIGAVYAISAPFVGWIGDKTGRTRILIVIGVLLGVLGYLGLGPTPLISFLPQKKVWMAAIALMILGLSYSFYLVPVMPDMMATALEHGLPDDIRTHGVLSGIFGSLISIGAFLGPTIGGTMNHYLGFNWSATILAGILAVQGVVLAVFSTCEALMKTSSSTKSTEGNITEDKVVNERTSLLHQEA